MVPRGACALPLTDSHADKLIPNVFETWPSVTVSASSTSAYACALPSPLLDIAFGTEKIADWLGVSSGARVQVSPIRFDASPAQPASQIRVKIVSGSVPHLKETLHKWLTVNVFFRHGTRVFFEEDDEFVLCELSAESTSSEDIFRFVQDVSTVVLDKTSILSAPIQLGGLDRQLAELEILANAVFNENSQLRAMNIKCPRGVLLHGPPGTGKTLLVKNLASRLAVPVVHVAASDCAGGSYGEAETKLQGRFNTAKAMSPCILFLDEIDSLCPKRDDQSSASSQRITTLLLTLLDGCVNHADTTRLLFVGATNAINAVDSALRRPGRFDREIEIPPPSRMDRQAILVSLLKPYRHELSEAEIVTVSDGCHGFVGADLSLLCKEAYLNALSDQTTPEIVSLQVKDFNAALTKVRPSAMREVYVEVPKTKWSDIGGQHLTKQKLVECVEWPIKVHVPDATRSHVSLAS